MVLKVYVYQNIPFPLEIILGYFEHYLCAVLSMEYSIILLTIKTNFRDLPFLLPSRPKLSG